MGFESSCLSAGTLILTKQERIGDQNFKWKRVILHQPCTKSLQTIGFLLFLGLPQTQICTSSRLSIQGWSGQLTLFSLDREVIRSCYAGGGTAALSMGDSALWLLLYIHPFVSPPQPLIYAQTSSLLHIVLWLKILAFSRLPGFG